MYVGVIDSWLSEVSISFVEGIETFSCHFVWNCLVARECFSCHSAAIKVNTYFSKTQIESALKCLNKEHLQYAHSV